MFWRGFSLVFAPLAILLAPLFFHASPEPRVGSYSGAYAAWLVVVWIVALASSLGLARLAQRRQSLLPPAYGLFLLVLAIAVFGISEVVLTLTLRGEDSFASYREWGHERSMIFGFEAAPDNEWTAAGATYTTDRHGFRTHLGGADWTSTAGPRVFALGGSSTFGYGLNDDETWPHLLEELLRAQPGHESVTVINAGNNGFNSLQNLLRYYLRVAPHAPSHFIYYGAFNDVWPQALWFDSVWIHEDILFAPSLVDYWARRSEGLNFYARSLSFYAFARGLGLEVASPGSEGLERIDGRPIEARDAAAPTLPMLKGLPPEEIDVILANAELFRRNIRTLGRAAHGDGVTPILATFIHALPPLSSRGRAIALHNRILRELAASEGVRLVDIERAFRRVPKAERASYFQKDGYHPASGAVEFIAGEIARAFESVPLDAQGPGA